MFEAIGAFIITAVGLVLGCLLLASPLILIAVLTGCAIKASKRDAKSDITNAMWDYKNKHGR